MRIFAQILCAIFPCRVLCADFRADIWPIFCARISVQSLTRILLRPFLAWRPHGERPKQSSLKASPNPSQDLCQSDLTRTRKNRKIVGAHLREREREERERERERERREKREERIEREKREKRGKREGDR